MLDQVKLRKQLGLELFLGPRLLSLGRLVAVGEEEEFLLFLNTYNLKLVQCYYPEIIPKETKYKYTYI